MLASIMLKCLIQPPNGCPGVPIEKKISRFQLLKRWIMLSTDYYLEDISIRETNCVIHWKEIYQLDSIIYLFKGPGVYIILKVK